MNNMDALRYRAGYYVDDDFEHEECSGGLPWQTDQAGYRIAARFDAWYHGPDYPLGTPDFWIRAPFPDQYPLDSHKRGYVCIEVRGYSYSYVLPLHPDTVWTVCSAHLQASGAGASYTVLQAQFYYDLAYNDLDEWPSVLAGDFNRTPSQAGMAFWTGGSHFEVDENEPTLADTYTTPNPGRFKKYDYIFSDKRQANVGSGDADVGCFTTSDHCFVEGYHQAK